jgi:sec-independent protein translocase protein TatA
MCSENIRGTAVLCHQISSGVTMFEGLFQPVHLLIIAGIALLVFGPKKLPELGKGLGESIRGFKSAMAAKEEKPANSNDRSPSER